MTPAGSAKLVRDVVNSLIRHCEMLCTEKAKTVMVKTEHIATLLEMEGDRTSHTMIGQVLRDLMHYLRNCRIDIIIRGVSNRRKYVLQCKDLKRIRELLEEYLKS
ncbi:MAG: hypothetical protein GXO26_09240 [Crenarchaeota archaeon]|nr:hypothetical protein [Thermoproteota archaeon]